MRRPLAVLLFAAACGSSSDPVAPDASSGPDSSSDPDAAVDGTGADDGFGTLAGMCGVLAQMDLTGPTPQFFRASITFEREFVDPADRPLLTDGGERMMNTPNAGGSSSLSEAFAFEQLTRCEDAVLVHTETEIMYDAPGKRTDLEISIQGVKLGVSVVRTFGYPLGTPYTLDQATTLIGRKLRDINESSMLVSPVDRWQKQFLAVIAWDDATTETVYEAWQSLDAETRADTQVVVVASHGADQFIYTE